MDNSQVERDCPIFLSASVTITPGQLLIPDVDALTNQNKRDMLVDEIHWSVYSNLTVTPNAALWLGQALRCQLLCGNFEITRDLVPLWTFGQTFDTRNEQATNSPYSLAIRNSALFFRWVLPRPLYVPAGVSIIPKIQLAALQAASTITNLNVSVGYAGSEIKRPVPGPACVPWVGTFTRDALSLVNGFAIISDEKQLVNPFNVPLNVHRFNLRGANTEDGVSTYSGDEITSQLLVRMYDSNMNDVTQVPLSEAGTFGFPTRTWTVPGVQIDPHAYYTALVQANAVVGGGSAASIGLSMIGWREENY